MGRLYSKKLGINGRLYDKLEYGTYCGNNLSVAFVRGEEFKMLTK
jgi:hypothetical protein